ncbi:MAG: tetratricopeptide repeat protein, partial [Phycisphaerae bacterium]|nr:tetratricopeptide repeat protein [Phycisphaerae bacterium]
WAFSVPQRLLIAGQALWFYTSKLLWPHPLAFIYPRWDIDQAAGWQYVFPVSAAGVMLALVLARRRIGKGPGAGVLFFAGTLVPALGFVNVYPMRFSFVADHFQYLASIGLIALACSLLWHLGRWLTRRGRLGVATAAVAALAMLGALGAATWRRTPIYRDAESVWQDTLTENPDCWVAHCNLGEIYRFAADSTTGPAAQGYLEHAAYHVYHAARLRPDFAESIATLGTSYASLGRHSEAINFFRRALHATPSFSIPDFEARVHHKLAMSLATCGRVDEAIAEYNETIRLAPRMAAAYNNLGLALMQKGRLQEAEEVYLQGLTIRPTLPQLHENLGVILEAKGDLAGAVQCYQAALALSPANGYMHRRLAFVLAKLGMPQPAVAAFNESVRLMGPDDQAAAALMRILKKTADVEIEGPTP